jgi:tetratricopeptide (TPR) repeat protein
MSATLHIAKKAIWHNPVTGTGPNTFGIDWSIYRPDAILSTALWNVDFPAGYSALFTAFATLGLLGIVAWILFFYSFVRKGWKALAFTFKTPDANYLIMSSLVMAIYFWISIIVSNPSGLIFMLAFAFTGLFIGVLVQNKLIDVYDSSFLRDPRASFFSIFFLVVLMIVSVFGVFMHSGKFASLVYYANSQAKSATLTDLNASERKLGYALSFSDNDVFYRSLSQVYLAEMNTLASDKSVSEDIMKSNLQSLVTKAVSAANQAISLNTKYYVNWVNLGDVYTSFLGMGITQGSYDNALQAYNKALALSPNSVSIILSKAQLEMVSKNNEGARTLVNQALEKKSNYIDALFTLAQIETNEGNLNEAIKLAEKAASYAPGDSTVFFKLGILRYNANNFSGAVSAFENAVVLNNAYLNARYFLGMSYQKLGRLDDAKKQFELLQQVLPDNQDIANALDGLKGSKIPVVTPGKPNPKLPLPEKKP